MSPPLYFDALVCPGPRNRKHSAQPWRLEDVIDELAHCSISGALVHDTRQVLYDAHHENLRLCDRLQPHDHLFPVWNLLPHQTGECPPPEELGDLLKQHDVRAVALHPVTNAWDWLADHSQPLLSWLSQQQHLTFVNHDEIGSFRDLTQILDRYPDLPLLLTGVPWRQQRQILPLLAQYDNLHLTLDKFQIHYGPEHFLEIGVTDQIVFGSHAPTMSAGAHRAYLDYADIPAEARARMAGGNLIRLLKGQQPPRLHTNEQEDELMHAARHGQPLPIPVIDLHMHILDDGLNGAGTNVRMQNGGPSGVFPLLKRLGCRGGGFMSWNGTVCPDSLAGNETVKKALDAAPAGFWGLGTFDPTHYSQQELAELIPALYADPRFIGMKPYFLYGRAYHHPDYDLWWEYGNTHHLYALMHRTRTDFEEIDVLAAKYPKVRWVVAHCGASYATADQAVACMNRHANVFAEITLTTVTGGIIDYLAKQAGSDRIIYGSDLPMRDPRQQLGWVVFSRLSAAEKCQVLHGNAWRIIQPCLERLPPHNRPPPPDIR